MKTSTHLALKTAVTAMLLLFAAPDGLGHKLDMRSQLTAGDRTARQKVRTHTDDGQTLYYPMILSLNDIDGGLSWLEDNGAVIFYTRQDMVLACVPRQNIDVIDRGQFVDRATIAQTSHLSTDIARAAAGVDAAHARQTNAGTATQYYDGTGVVTALCDIGFDPGHIAFRDKTGMTVHYVDSLALRTVYAPQSTMHTPGSQNTTDTDDETHASHVANIMAGAKEGNPYYGVAPGSTLVAVTSQLSDMALLAGIEDAVAFGKENGMPVVVNLSVSSHLGPRDGTDLVNRYLDLLGQDAIICFSAGNTGHRQCSMRHVFENTNGSDGTADAVGSMFESQRSWDGHNIDGMMDVWSDDARGFEMQIVAYDQITKQFIYRSPWFGDMTGAAEGTFDIGCHNDDTLATYFEDTQITVKFGIDPGNGRFAALMRYYVETPYDLDPAGPHWARYIAGWRVRAKAGTGIRAYCDAIYSYMRRYGVPGMRDGDAGMSVSNLCANNRTICVGAWTSRNTVPVWGSDDRTLGDDTGTVAFFSSYGTLPDGRTLPHICAPGSHLVSAMSKPFAQKYPGHEFSYRDNVGNQWYWERGTSMSSPMVAGTIALWLQHNPDLTVSQARDILQQTADKNVTDPANPRWGAGALDAAKGLQAVIDLDGVGNINADTTGRATHYYNLQGVMLTGLPTTPGIYIEKRGTVTRKIAVH